MRISASIAISASMVALFVGSCSRPAEKSSNAKPKGAPTVSQMETPASSPPTSPFVSQTAAPPVSRTRPVPPDAAERSIAAEFDGFRYSYKKDGTKTVATFASKPLAPGDDIVGAIRDIIERSYGDKANAAPRRVGVGAEQSIRIAGNKDQYVVVPIKEANGEIRSLIITQLAD